MLPYSALIQLSPANILSNQEITKNCRRGIEKVKRPQVRGSRKENIKHYWNFPLRGPHSTPKTEKKIKKVLHAMPPILYDMGHLTDARGLIHPESSKLEAYHLTMIFAMGAPHPPTKKYCKNRDHIKAISSVLSG